MKDLKKIEMSLDKLHLDFNLQLNELGNDAKEFHNALIELSAKYPDHKELLQFIVHINDKLETNHTLFSEIITDSFNELVKVKKDIVQKMIEEKEVRETKEAEAGFWKKTLKMAINIKDVKVLLFYIALITAVGGAIFAPDASVEIIKAAAKLVG